jgi:hypothetical protein
MRSNLVLVCKFDIKMVSLENILIYFFKIYFYKKKQKKPDFVFNNFKKRRGTSILNTALAG